MRRGDEVTTTELESLLAELQDAGGHVATGTGASANGALNASKPYSPNGGGAHGYAGSMSVLRDQSNANPSALTALRRSSGTAGKLGRPAAESGDEHAGATSAGFSSYAPAGLTDGELRSARHAITPMGIRLAPLNSTALADAPVATATARLQPSPPLATTGLHPHGKSSSPQRRGSKLPDLSPTAAAPGAPLSSPPRPPVDRRGSVGTGARLSIPSIPTTNPSPASELTAATTSPPAAAAAAAAAPATGTAPKRDFSFRNYRQFLAEVESEDRAKAEQGDDSVQREISTSGDGAVSTPYREANFLPIMCARYLSPAGISPAPRWGHSLTPLGGESSSGVRLYAFGGMELSGQESNTLMVFDTAAIAWDPVHVVAPLSAGGGGGGAALPVPAEAPPAPRYNHSACAYEDRYIVVYGGAAKSATETFNDVHLYDAQTHCWRCVWRGSGGARSKNEPSGRFGHTAVIRDDRMYVFGGKQRAASGSKAATTTAVASADVYVFSLSQYRWKKRIRAKAAAAAAAAAATASGGPQPQTEQQPPRTAPAETAGGGGPCPRAYHAAAVKGSMLYVHGGSSTDGVVLADTWQLDLSASAAGGWVCLHRGDSADAIPRERHELFACGEALLVVGGCSASSFSAAVAGKFNNFVAVLPLVGATAGACWIPVAMGNVSIVAPSRKNFSAALSGGFVYVFGGMSGTEPATNTMVRFLAADGYVAADARANAAANEEALRVLTQQLCERPTVPHDTIVVTDAATVSSASGGAGAAEDKAAYTFLSAAAADAVRRRAVGFHKAVLLQRAPKLLECLRACRSDTTLVSLSTSALAGPTGASVATGAGAGGGGGGGASSNEGDVVDRLLQHTAGSAGAGAAEAAGAGAVSGPVAGQVTTYYASGNSRVAGLPHPLTAEALASVAGYVYWGGLPPEFRRLLREEEDDDDEEPEATEPDGATGAGDAGRTPDKSGVGAGRRQHIKDVLHQVRTAAEDYALEPLVRLVDALLEGNRKNYRRAQDKATRLLRADMARMLDGGAGASVTVLFVDPHTKQQTAHALHPSILMLSSRLFLDLLRPLFNGEKTQFHVGAVASKVTLPAASASASAPPTLLYGSSGTVSKRAVLVGPVAVPALATHAILRYLYTQELHVPREIAFEVMLGAHQLGLPLLQAYCEAIVAREEVNYDTCCSFCFLARKYSAALLEETSLLTAVSGYATVRQQSAYLNLPDEVKKSIDAVASELGSATWVPPPQPSSELKPKEVYAARWNSSAA